VSAVPTALWTQVAQLESDHAAALRRIAQLDGELVQWKHVAEMDAASARRLADKVREAEERSQRAYDRGWAAGRECAREEST
jgi:uncharacterized coiled-coil protein SlyX